MVKEALQYLMDRCYFTFGNTLLYQVIGIPMGSDPAPFMANLFLYYFESKWIKGLKKENLQIARRFANTFRFIDDLLTVNDDDFFAQNYKDIYPPELQLNLESSGNEVSFLDLHLTKVDRRVDIKLFDKRDDFPFSIVRLPYACSNIPTSMFYSSIGAEITRIGRICSCLDSFLVSGRQLVDRALKQGAKCEKLEKTFKKCYGRQQSLKVFGNDAAHFSNMLLNDKM